MRLREDQIQGLAIRTVSRLTIGGLIESKAPESQLNEAVVSIFLQFSDSARTIDEEVKKLMAQYSSQMNTGQVDTQKMYGMIRKQVAKKYHFELDPEEQISVLAHQIHDRLHHDDLVDYPEEEKALRQIKETLRETLLADELLGEKVREKIRSLKRGVAEGSAEWNILYEKYLEEELNKRRL